MILKLLGFLFYFLLGWQTKTLRLHIRIRCVRGICLVSDQRLYIFCLRSLSFEL